MAKVTSRVRVTTRCVLAGFGVIALSAVAVPALAQSTSLTYHGDNARSGNDTTEPTLTPTARAWTADLGGAVYGQPVVDDGRIIVATEDDVVFSLDAHDGHVLWEDNIGTPLTHVQAVTGCGDIDPLGVTSTPAIDPATGTVFVVAEETSPTIHHQLFGINILTGTLTVSANADPPAAQQDPVHIQQRQALAVANGRVYIGYGGFSGDCGTYHGWVVSLTEQGTAPISFDATPHTFQGAIWSTGGPAVDAEGNIYEATGNPNPQVATHDYGESALKLSPTLQVESVFSGSNAEDDEDLGSVSPALLGNGLVFIIGKQHDGYLLDTANLADVVQTLPGICATDADGADAWDGSHLYIPCNAGIVKVDIDTATRRATVDPAWSAPSGDSFGPPTLAGGLVWTTEWNTGVLYGLNPVTGATVVTEALGVGEPHFATPTTALGLVLQGTASGVMAFDGPAGLPAPAPIPSCRRPAGTGGYLISAADGGVFTFGDAAFCGSRGGQPLNAPIISGAGTPDGGGYWLVASDGGIFTYGDATFYGSHGASPLNQPIVGIAATPTGHGYWLVASDGGIFTYGDATFYGSTGANPLNQPIVGIAATPTGHGYWLVASDGGIFTYGDATFYGSHGANPLNQPIVGIAATPNGHGYWLVASDGGIFTYGDATFYGSTGANPLNQPIVGIAATPTGHGYWLVASDGGIFTYGDAPFLGSKGGEPLNAPIVTLSASP